MTLPRFELVEPQELAGACAAAGPGSRFLAGGTDLLVQMKRRRQVPERVIALEGLAELRGIEETPAGGLRLGALTTLAELVDYGGRHPRWRGLAGAPAQAASPLLRNAGTVGGNLCLDARCTFYNQPPIFTQRWGPCLKIGGAVCHAVRRSPTCRAVYSGDLAGPLLALGASAVLAGPTGDGTAGDGTAGDGPAARCTVPLAQLFSGDGAQPVALADGEILVEVQIPPLAQPAGFSYQKLRLRDTLDFPLAGVSVYLGFAGPPAAHPCTEARVVLNACGPAPVAVPETGAALRGRHLHAADRETAIAQVATLLQDVARPVANTAAPAAYRRKMIPVMARRAIEAALNQAGERED